MTAAMASPSAPNRTYEQRMDALNRANEIRGKRAQLKRDVRAGLEGLVPLLGNPPEYIGTMKVMDLMLATPKYGRVKVGKILSKCRISPSKTIGGLSERQRGEIVDYLVGRARL